MLSSVIGGLLVAFSFLLIAMLKRAAQGEPKPFWSRSEAIESLVAVGLVCMIALGFALVVSSVSGGWIPPTLGLVVAVAGSIAAFLFGGRSGKAARAAPTSAQTA